MTGALALEAQRQRPPQQAVAEHLRRQRAPQSVSRHGARAPPVAVRRLQRVAHRHREQAADRIVTDACANSDVRSSRRRHGRAASCTSTQSASRATPASASSARRTDASRRSPPMQHCDARIAATRAGAASGDRRAPAPRSRRRSTVPRAARAATRTAWAAPARACTAWGVGRRSAGRVPAAGTIAQRRAAAVISPSAWAVRCSAGVAAALAGAGGTTWKNVSLPPIMPRSVRARSSMAARPSLRSRTSAASVLLRSFSRSFSSDLQRDGLLETPHVAHAVGRHPETVLQREHRREQEAGHDPDRHGRERLPESTQIAAFLQHGFRRSSTGSGIGNASRPA